MLFVEWMDKTSFNPVGDGRSMVLPIDEIVWAVFLGSLVVRIVRVLIGLFSLPSSEQKNASRHQTS